MNNLQVKTIELEPAVIKFNHTDIEKELQKNLAKYDGLTFTSESTTELRSTLAELRKGKRAVDEYRKKVKRELNAPVKAFEDTCKGLNQYFDDVINPLDDQLKTFVEQERAEKLEQLENIKVEHIETHGLDEEYIDRVEIKDNFLSKSTSIKTASESIEFQVKNLKMEQDKKKADKEIIETTVKLANAKNELSLSADAYIRLLEFDDVEVVKNQISNDVEKDLQKREQDRIKKEQAEKAEQERIEKERLEQEAIDSLEEPIMNAVATSIENASEFEQVPSSSAPSSVSIDDLPFSDPVEFDPTADPFADDFNNGGERLYTEVIEFTCTADSFDKLVEFMKENNIDWTRKVAE